MGRIHAHRTCNTTIAARYRHAVRILTSDINNDLLLQFPFSNLRMALCDCLATPSPTVLTPTPTPAPTPTLTTTPTSIPSTGARVKWIWNCWHQSRKLIDVFFKLPLPRHRHLRPRGLLSRSCFLSFKLNVHFDSRDLLMVFTCTLHLILTSR